MLGSNPAGGTSFRNVGNSVYPTLPVSFRGNSKKRWSFLSGLYARGRKISMCNLPWTPPLLEKDNSNIYPVYNTKKYECSQYRKKN